MKNKVYETIIIGAGIAGLACARKLHENGKEFLVISENIGGRCGEYSENGIPCGAYFVMDNYQHFKKFIRIGRRICPSKIRFHGKKGAYTIWSRELLAHPFQLLKLIFLVYKFKRHYEKFKKKCETMPQTKAIKSDPYFHEIYNQNAKDFVKKHKITDLAESFIEYLLYGGCISPLHKCKANNFLWISLFVIIPSYEFLFLKDEMIKGFKENIKIGSVAKISKEKDFYSIKTKKKTFKSKNLVVATPPNTSQKLLNLKDMRKNNNCHIFHISGKVRKHYDNCMINFLINDSTYVLAKQKDETFIFLTEKSNPRFEDYFYNYKIIRHKFWNPAFNMLGNVCWECKLDKNLYLIGDHNATNLEDTFITGLYAANRIINSTV